MTEQQKAYCPRCGNHNHPTGSIDGVLHYRCWDCHYEFGMKPDQGLSKVWQVLYDAMLKVPVPKNVRHEANKILAEYMPSGSGFDTDWRLCNHDDEPLIYSAFHVMNDHGFYVGWLPFWFTIKKENTQHGFDIDVHFNEGILSTIEEDTDQEGSTYTDYIEDTIYECLKKEYKEVNHGS